MIRRHETIAQAARRGVTAMGLELWVAREEIAASCVMGAVMPQGVDDEQYRARRRDHYGVMISGGYGELRLGHMGMAAHPTYLCAQQMVERTLADLGVPVTLGQGVGAALASLADWGEPT